MNLFEILFDCSDASIQGLLAALRLVVEIIRWLVPAVLIILGSIDMFKAMANGKEDEQKKAQKTFIRRLIYGLIIFLIPFIIRVAFSLLGNIFGTNAEGVQTDNFFSCYNNATVAKGKCFNSQNQQVMVDKETCLNDEKCPNCSWTE